MVLGTQGRCYIHNRHTVKITFCCKGYYVHFLLELGTSTRRRKVLSLSLFYCSTCEGSTYAGFQLYRVPLSCGFAYPGFHLAKVLLTQGSAYPGFCLPRVHVYTQYLCLWLMDPFVLVMMVIVFVIFLSRFFEAGFIEIEAPRLHPRQVNEPSKRNEW